MTDIPTTPRRIEQVRDKHITLTINGCEQILAWSEAEGLTFSGAIEVLALLGLESKGQETAWQIVLLRNLVAQVFEGQIHRFARLLGTMLFDVDYCRTMLDALALQVVRQTAEKHPDTLAKAMIVRPDSQDKVDKAIRQMHEKWKQSVEAKTRQQLRERLEEEKPWLLAYLVRGEEQDEA